MTDYQNIGVDYYESEINDILIIGESETSFVFSQNLHDTDQFTRVFHVVHATDAMKLLVQQEFSVIVIDNDANDVDPIKLSNSIRDNYPLCRIVIISEYHSVQLIKDLINYASIDAFLPVPIDPYSGSSIIIEQYAKYQINQTLFNLVSVSPPKFSQSYYLLNDPNLRDEVQNKIQFVGFVIIYSSITKYSNFYSNMVNIDEYLLTGYISAFSLLGQQIFAEHSFFKEINFGDLSVVMYQEYEVQYLFFFKDMTKTSLEKVENAINSLIKKIHADYSSHLTTEVPLLHSIEDEISAMVNTFYEAHERIVDLDRKQNLVLYGNQLPKLNKILARQSDKFNIWRFFKSEDVLNHLIENDVDILLINQILDNNEWNFSLANQAKDITPAIQIVALLERFNQADLLKILNDDNLDFVLSYKDDPQEIEDNLNQAYQEANKIQNYLTNYHPHNMQYSLHRSAIARSMLRNYTSSFQISNVPEFYGIYIMQADLPYYTKLWELESTQNILFDEQLFAGFVTSMEMFTAEIFDTNEEFSGFRFGEITILIKHQFEFAFIFFLGNIDHTNFLMVERQIELFSSVLYSTIINSDGFFDFDPDKQYDVTRLIDQHLTELYIQFVSLNFSF